MAKAGMKRPGSDDLPNKRRKNEVDPVSEIQGKAKSRRKKADKEKG